MFVFTRDYAGRRRISKRIPGRSDCTVMRGTTGALCRSGSGGVGAPNWIRQFPDGDSRDHHQKGTRNMAQQTTVTLTDDLDGGKAAETVTFGLDGRIYEIDLSRKDWKRPSPWTRPRPGTGGDRRAIPGCRGLNYRAISRPVGRVRQMAAFFVSASPVLPSGRDSRP